jgi:hypothetical protein
VVFASLEENQIEREGFFWWDLCSATKLGSEMMARHSLETHQNLLTDFSGTRERMLKIISLGNEKMAPELRRQRLADGGTS